MTDLEPDDEAGPPSAMNESPNRRSPRRDPAAMRETLDAARRRLGPAGPNDGPPQSAARQRALLREAVANQSVPLVEEPTPPSRAVPADPPSGPDTEHESDADGSDAEHGSDAG
jgi:hypothetical protein